MAKIKPMKASNAREAILLRALERIRDLDAKSCEAYVRKADDIACEALARYEHHEAEAA
jgi:hypothetical protein